MRKFLTLGFILVILISLGIILIKPKLQEQQQENLVLSTSDAAKIKRTITIAGDDWLGYLIFRSRAFASKMAQHEVGVRYEMVFDFQQRIQGLSSGKYQFCTITLDSYLRYGNQFQWPGSILWVIDESFGGDAIVAIPPIEKIDDLNGENVKGAYTSGSPSEFLLRSQIAHFNLSHLQETYPQFGVSQVEEAFNQLKQGRVQFAVLWEPFVTKTLREIPNAKMLVSTKTARDLIIDIFIASRQTLQNDPELARQIGEAYFSTLHELLNNPSEFLKVAVADVRSRNTNTSAEEAKTMLDGIRFASYHENLDWLNEENPGLANSIQALAHILPTFGETVHLPHSDPKSILYSPIVHSLSGIPVLQTTQPKLNPLYRPLSTTQWLELANNPKGTLVDTPLLFRPGQTDLPEETKEEIQTALPSLIHYPEYRIIVEAHSHGNSQEEDQKLSEERAVAVRQFLVWEGGIPEERVFAVGKGSTEALTRGSGESQSAYLRRNRRAKIILVGEN